MTASESTSPRQLVERFVETVNRRDYDALGELVSETLVRHSQSTPGVAVESLEQFVALLRDEEATFGDVRISTDRIVAEGDEVALLGRWRGTQIGPLGHLESLGRTATVVMSGFFRLEAGRIAEIWVIWDNVALLEQLGHAEGP